MNKERRKRIEELSTKLSECKEEADALQEEEQEYYDNMPENMQGGEKGETAQSAIDAMQEASDNIDAAIGNLNDATGG